MIEYCISWDITLFQLYIYKQFTDYKDTKVIDFRLLKYSWIIYGSAGYKLTNFSEKKSATNSDEIHTMGLTWKYKWKRTKIMLRMILKENY